MYLESNNKMQLKNRERTTFLICFDEKEIEREGFVMYAYEAVRVPISFNYSMLVSAIIKEKYSDDKMQAIINNHLLEINNEEHEKEFNEMQSWRLHAKEIARIIIENN